MEENGIRAKVVRRVSDAGSEKKNKKLVCFVCSEKGNMKVCVACERPACSSHSMATAVMSQNRICDLCYREEALKICSADALLRDKLSQEISELADLRDANTQTLNKSSAKIRNLEKETQERENTLSKELKDIQNSINNIKEQSKMESDSLPCMQKEKIDNEMQFEVKRQKLESISEESRTVKAELDILIKERTILVNELNEVSDFIRSYVPVKILRQAICNPCYQQVRHAFVQVFKPVVPIKEELQQSSQVKNAQNRKGMCTACEVF